MRPPLRDSLETAERGAWLTACAVIVTITASALSSAWVNHDAGWYLHVAGIWLDGGKLYRDAIDTNPPLIIALTAIPVALARLLDLPIPAVFKTTVFVSSTLVGIVTWPLCRRIYRAAGPRLIVSVTALFLLLPFARADFGQREHLAALMVTPYVLAAAAWVNGQPLPRRLDASLGVLAGVGFALKPHFLLALVSIEGCVLLLQTQPRHMLRPAAVGAVTFLVLYAVATVVLVPQYLGVALEVAEVYGGLNAPAALLLTLPEIGFWVAALVSVGLLRLNGPSWRSSAVLFAAATGFLLAALLQRKGWGYHLYPARVFTHLVLASVVASALDRSSPYARVTRSVRQVAAAALIVSLSVTSWRYRSGAFDPDGVELVKALHSVVVDQRVESVAMLGMRTIIFPAFPVVNYSEARWVMRHHSMWFLPGLYTEALAQSTGVVAHRSLERMPPLERKYFEQVVSDLCADPPRLLIVEPPPQAVRAGAGSLDLTAYYSQDERFARLFGTFIRHGSVGPFVLYLRMSDFSCNLSRMWPPGSNPEQGGKHDDGVR